jgi:hypothetical protein
MKKNRKEYRNKHPKTWQEVISTRLDRYSVPGRQNNDK